MIRYDISPLDPEAHLFIVAVTIDEPTPQEQFLRLPNWIAGSYMIRDFAGFIQAEQAFLGGNPVPVAKVDKCTWRVSTVGRKPGENLCVCYQVWAGDRSVRGNYLDNCRGFFNPAATFMQVLGAGAGKITVNITPPVDEAHVGSFGWRVATGLKRAKGTKRFGWGLYEARDYAELADCPVELSDFTVVTFKAHGKRHDAVFNDTPANFDAQRVQEDLQRICETEIEFFEPQTCRPPVDEYTFLINAGSNVYGGLEHANSTALAVNRAWLPSVHDKERTEDYRKFLALASHEYFHTWLVKRIRPGAFVDMDLHEETYTDLLWLFEGFTSYYESLVLRRAGLIDNAQLAKLLSADLKNVLQGNARHMQSLAEASFDAWIKFYRPNSNSANSHVSYYRQGAMAAWVLDGVLRTKTRGKKSLDDVVRLMWEDFKAAGDDYSGIDSDDFAEIVLRATGVDLTDLIGRLTQTVFDADYGTLLKPLGVTLKETELDRARALLGLAGKGQEAGFAVTCVYEQEAAQWLGISAGDILIAIDGQRVHGGNLEKLLARYAEGDEMVIHAFRDDCLLAWQLLLGKPKQLAASVEIKPTRLGKAWLEGGPKAAGTKGQATAGSTPDADASTGSGD